MYFLFDANFSHRLAEGLKILEDGNDRAREVFVTIDHTEKIQSLRSAPDADIILFAGKHNAIIVSQDDDFKRLKANKELIKTLKVGYVHYKPPKHGSRYWDIVESFIKGWKVLKEKLNDKEPPFVCQIDKAGNPTFLDIL
jgi:predicted metal-dependent hydrolase